MLFIHKSTTKRASDINFLSPSFVHFVWFNPPRFLSDDAFAVLLMTCRARAVRLRVGAFQRIQTTPKSRWKLSKIRKQLPFQSLFVFRLWLGESIKTNEWEAAGWVCSCVLSLSKSCLRKLLTKHWSRPQVCFHKFASTKFRYEVSFCFPLHPSATSSSERRFSKHGRTGTTSTAATSASSRWVALVSVTSCLERQ